MANKKYLDLDSLKEYHLKIKPVIESKANSSEVYNKNDVYTKDQVDSALDSKSDVGHTHDQYITEQNVYTKEQVDLALESKSDISHTHDQYLTDIGIDILFDGSDTLKGTATDYKILGVDSTKTYYLSGTKFIGTGCTNITITPITATSANCTYDEETGIVSWTIYGTSSSGPVSANLSWTGAPGILTSTKDGIKTTVGYFNTINGESVVSKTGAKDFDIYTKNQIDTKLDDKANVSDVYTTSQVDTKLSEKANSSDVYTTTQVDTKLSSKADTSNVYNKSEINTKLNAKANVSDVYTTSQVDTKLSEKANSSDVYTTEQVDTKLSEKANSSDVYTTTQVDNKLNLKANSSDVYTTTQVDNKLSDKLPIIGTASSGETKVYNRYAQKGYSGGSSTYWYYKIATLPAYNSSGNYASLIITGRIGGWEASNMSSINALVFNRGEEGIVAIDLAKTSSRAAYNLCDIVCYREEHGETSVYLKCASYFTFDISIEAYQHNIILPTSISKLTSVTGTEQVKLSTTKSRLEVYNGNAYIGGTRLVKSNESLKNPNSLTFGSQTYDGSAAKTITASDLSAYTKTEVDTSLNAKANASDVYSKSDVDTKLSGKADKAATLSGYGITNAYTKTEINNLINSKAKTVVFDTYNKFIEFLEDTSQATYDYFNVGDSIYIKEEGSDYWISGKEDIVEDGDVYRYISGTTGSDLLGTDNIFRTTVTENIGTTYTSVIVDEIEPLGGSCGYSNFSWNSSTGVVTITLESLQPSKNVTAVLKCHVSASGGGDYGYYYISNIGPDISRKADKATTLSGYGITNAYTKTEVDTKLSGKADKATTLSGYGITNAYTKTESDNKYAPKSHDHNSKYVSSVTITSSSSGSKNVGGKAGTTPEDLGDGAVYKLRGTENIGLGATNVTITPTGLTKSASGSYNASTGDYSWTLITAAKGGIVAGTIKWSGGDDQLKITKNGSENVVGYFNKINGQSIVALTDPKDFSFYTKTETDNKYAPKSHSHESIIDYGDTSNTIKIGYRGNGLTASQIAYIAGYSVDDPNNPNEHKIKDISKDVLKSWLGSEVVTGSLSSGSSLTIASSTYVWIVYPQIYSTNTFSFSIGSSNYTGYHFAIIQSGTPGCIRYFSSTTTLRSAATTSITFSTAVNYVRFKIG